jgi:predicted metal-dependent hydrolase
LIVLAPWLDYQTTVESKPRTSLSNCCRVGTDCPGYAMDAIESDPHYLQGIEFFNACDFFEAHEAWEDLWTDYQGPSRKFFQGLIQTAVALHHFGNGNIRGAKKLYHSSRAYLEPYRPFHLGIDLEKFLAQFDCCFAEVLANTEEFPQVEIDADQIPEIHLEAPPAG